MNIKNRQEHSVRSLEAVGRSRLRYTVLRRSILPPAFRETRPWRTLAHEMLAASVDDCVSGDASRAGRSPGAAGEGAGDVYCRRWAGAVAVRGRTTAHQ